MSGTRRGHVLPVLALVCVTAVWGSTFFLIKDLLHQVSPVDFLGVRFALAALVIVVCCGRRLLRAGARVWALGGVLGLVYAAAQIAQTVGLAHTPASVSGFITGMYVVLTPVLMLLVFRHRVALATWFSVGLATVGLMVLSLTGLSFGSGEALTLLGSLLYALHIVLLGRWAGREDPFTLALVQVVAVGVVCTLAALPGGIGAPTTPSAWGWLVYMALVAGLGALVAQTWAQSRIPATSAAVVMTTEPVFAAGFAIAFGGEQPTARLLVGGGLVLVAMFVTELAPGLAPRRTAPRSSRSLHAPVEGDRP
ncbi:MAG TPA: DMT family transporter [Cellulomonas sp.]